MIEPSHQSLSIVTQCDLLNLNRGSYYNVIADPTTYTEDPYNLELMQLIDEEYKNTYAIPSMILAR